jgi:hypothetical protein
LDRISCCVRVRGLVASAGSPKWSVDEEEDWEDAAGDIPSRNMIIGRMQQVIPRAET